MRSRSWYCPWISPQIWIGASSSSSPGWLMRTFLLSTTMNSTSSLVSCTVVPGFLSRTASSFSMITSHFSSVMFGSELPRLRQGPARHTSGSSAGQQRAAAPQARGGAPQAEGTAPSPPHTGRLGPSMRIPHQLHSSCQLSALGCKQLAVRRLIKRV